MKVGTDAILLAVWCDINDTSFILDVGTGSGIIALLLATRSKSIIHAIELDDNSATEAALNFKNYQTNKISLFHDDFNIFADCTTQKYDLIITNPPFFSDSLLPSNNSRKAARHTTKLNYQQLCKGVASMLSKKGRFCLVLPYNLASNFIKTALFFNLHLHKQLVIYPKPNRQPNRINLEFRAEEVLNVITDEVIIRNNDGSYSNQYKSYVNMYLMKMQ